MRAALIAGSIAVAVVVAVVATPFGDTISDRLGTLNQAPTEDGSGQERIQEYITLFNAPDSNLFGNGFSITDAGTPGAMPIDGQIVACWISMGIVVGLTCLASLVWAACSALVGVARCRDAPRVALGAIIVGALVQIPLAGIASGELGVLFWMCVALASAPQTVNTTAPSLRLAARSVFDRPGLASS
jgi:hypothetical protein